MILVGRTAFVKYCAFQPNWMTKDLRLPEKILRLEIQIKQVNIKSKNGSNPK